MEDNNSSMPEFCTNGCGFFGNQIFNNMCSQCYKKSQQNSNPGSDKMAPSAPETPPSAQILNSLTPELEKPTAVELEKPVEVAPVAEEAVSPAESLASSSQTPASSSASTDTAVPAEDSTPTKPTQINKGRCFLCRVKIPLAKQQINKCRCDYVFCDAHRYPDKHDCDFDYAGTGRQQLARSNPKLNERPKGGRSFQRIDND